MYFSTWEYKTKERNSSYFFRNFEFNLIPVKVFHIPIREYLDKKDQKEIRKSRILYFDHPANSS